MATKSQFFKMNHKFCVQKTRAQIFNEK